MFNFLLDVFTIEAVEVILYYTSIFFVLYLLGYSTFLFISVLSGENELFENIKNQELKNKIHNDYYVPISIIVPAYNEEVTIIKTIKSLLNLNYATYEIVVVNDGSSDGTLNVLIEEFALKQVHRPIRKKIPVADHLGIYQNKDGQKVSIRVIDKVNGGKANSINMGINASKFPYFVCMDSDSILEVNSLTKIAKPILEYKDVVAVGSKIHISNDSIFEKGKLVELRLPKRIVPAMQVLEYERSFLASRIFLDKFNANLIISGAFGLFDKAAVIEVGGYQTGSMGEDMELIVKLHSYYRSNDLPYKIKYAYEAVCWTQVPESMGDLLKQRKRWHIGLFQSLSQHKNLFSTGSYLYYLVYELLSPFIELAGLFITVLAWVFGLLNVQYMIFFFIVYALFGSMLTIISFLTRNYLSDAKIRKRDIVRAFLLAVPENIVLRFILAWTRMSALLFYRKDKTNWGSIKRVEINYEP